MSNLESLEVAGVPMVIRPPANPNLPAGLIILWHGFGTPNNEILLAETLPLEDVQAQMRLPRTTISWNTLEDRSF